MSVSRSNGSATATFADGSTAAGALLVGCEGVHFHIREALVGKDAAASSPIDYQIINTCWKLHADIALLRRKAHPIFRIGYHLLDFSNLRGIHVCSCVAIPRS